MPWLLQIGFISKMSKSQSFTQPVTLQNVTIAARGVVEDEPELLWGMEDGLIYGLVFEDVTIGNESVTGVDFFHHNEYVF